VSCIATNESSGWKSLLLNSVRKTQDLVRKTQNSLRMTHDSVRKTRDVVRKTQVSVRKTQKWLSCIDTKESSGKQSLLERFGFRVLGFGFRVSGFGCREWGLEV